MTTFEKPRCDLCGAYNPDLTDGVCQHIAACEGRQMLLRGEDPAAAAAHAQGLERGDDLSDVTLSWDEFTAKVSEADSADTTSRLLAQTMQNIAEYGWHDTGVFPTDESPEGTPAFNYTTGFTERGWPEVIVVGLPPTIAHGVLQSVWERWDLLDGPACDPDTDYPEIFHTFSARYRPIGDPRQTGMNLTCRFYDGVPWRAVQLLWPDANGVFPGQLGYDLHLPSQDLSATMTGD